MNIANRLKTAIKQLNLNYKDFSKQTNISYTTLLQYLSNKREPNSENLQKIVCHLNINLNWLLTGEGEMFKSDSVSETKNIGMPSEFIEKLKDDLKDKDDSFYTNISISKDKLFDVLFGKTKLKRIEVIELAGKLNGSLDEYMYLSGYMPPEFERILQKPRMMGALRAAGRLSDKDIDQAIEGFVDVLQQYEKRHKKPR